MGEMNEVMVVVCWLFVGVAGVMVGWVLRDHWQDVIDQAKEIEGE